MVAGLDLHGHIQFAFGLAAKDAVRGRNVGVVAADRGADVPVMRDQIVGGIDANPSQMRQERFDPGVRRVGGRAVVVLAAAIQIARDVARGNADMAQQRDHGVGEVLADAFAAHDGFVDRRVDARGARHVIEVVKEALVQLKHQLQRIVAARHVHLLRELDERRRLRLQMLLGSSISQ